MSKKKTSALVAMLVAAAAACAATVPAHGVSSARLAVYEGPGKTAAVDSFQKWLARGQVDASDYVDPADGGPGQWNQWAFSYWGNWKKAQANRQFILGLPLLPRNGNFKDALAGKYDAQFKQVAAQMQANGLGGSVIRLGYEPNNVNIGPWQGTSDPASYKAMFRRVVGIMGRTAFRFDYNSAVGPSGKATSFDSLYPGDDVVDIVGLNVYDVHWGVTQSPTDRWNYITTRQMGINDFQKFAATHSKPKSFPEWGLYRSGDSYHGGGDDPYFVDQMAALVSGSAYHSYFNVNWANSGTLDSFPNAKADYKAKFGSQ